MVRDGPPQLLCLTASSGVPLFVRGGRGPPMPFSVLGSLNGVHMFGGAQGVGVRSCRAEGGGAVAWRVFQDALMLIAVGGSGWEEEEEPLQRLLEDAWSCMVLVLGLEELTSPRNVERLKRELRSCYGLLDLLLGGGPEGALGALTRCADCLLPPDPGPLQDAVEGFARSVGSEFACLLVRGRVAAATEKWWRLAPQEVVLLSALVRSLGASGAAAGDCPVFLPRGSPGVAHRLLRFQLLPGADACVLCGPSPSLHRALTGLAAPFWAPLAEALRDCLAVGERCMPPSVQLRPDVMALLLINREARRSVSLVQPSLQAGGDGAPPPPSKARCWELLKLFYGFAATRYFAQDDSPEDGDGGGGGGLDSAVAFPHSPLQCYLVTDECKCFGLQTPQHQLFLLAPLSAPTFALRAVASQTLADIVAATGF